MIAAAYFTVAIVAALSSLVFCILCTSEPVNLERILIVALAWPAILTILVVWLVKEVINTSIEVVNRKLRRSR